MHALHIFILKIKHLFECIKKTPLLKLFSWMVLLRLRLKVEMWCLRTNYGMSDCLEDAKRRQDKGDGPWVPVDGEMVSTVPGNLGAEQDLY